MFIQYLGRREVEILLRHMYSPLSQRVHACFRAYTLELGSAAPVHFLGGFVEVDAPRKVHGAGVDAEDVGAGFDSGEGRGISFRGFRPGGMERGMEGGEERLTWVAGIQFSDLYVLGGEGPGLEYRVCWLP